MRRPDLISGSFNPYCQIATNPVKNHFVVLLTLVTFAHYSHKKTLKVSLQ